ncbi:hypothetical protein AAFF_G00370630 [Aldrovandia affinis]|uniref:DNA polymerase delta subunit 3 n=1 Tax=Aldrovandia affinis TaxID=143900 RepID=A0AAD7SH12_9TELE|nr:hypothetical protein AAFF_G00370630 [Aldrovandia affinis]
MDDLYLDNIDEFVHDHNKIVTYKWLSLTLGVHVNQAKQMLYHYLDQKKRESSGSRLHATYLVSGKCVENGNISHKVAVVREDQLEDVKSKMELTASIHVYSIQKAVLKDSGPLYSTDYDAVKENLKNCSKYSAIRCASAVPMSPAEVQRPQEMTQVPPETETNKSVLNGHSSQASKPAPKQPKGIMGMFANKSTPKTQECSKEVKMEVEDDASMAGTSKSKPSAKMNAMSNFFGKPISSKTKSSTEKSEKVIKEEVGRPQMSSVTKEKPSSSPPKVQVGIKEEEPKSSEAEVKKSKDRSKTKRLEPSDSEDEKFESRKKKRRRIKKPQPDSSDDEVVPESPPSHDVETPTPSPESQVKKEPVQHTEEKMGGSRRKRRKVLKSHTFVDEEGCIVTEKRYENESYSESEDDFKAQKSASKGPAPLKPYTGKKEEDKRSQKKAAANKTTKQASIMGFFQKK